MPDLLKLVAGGERVTISRYNTPVADLIPTAQLELPSPKFGTGKGKKILDPKWARAMTDREIDEIWG